jgi:hypothetical protein
MFLHNSMKILPWPTAHLTKTFFLPAVSLLTEISWSPHFYFLVLPLTEEILKINVLPLPSHSITSH